MFVFFSIEAYKKLQVNFAFILVVSQSMQRNIYCYEHIQADNITNAWNCVPLVATF